MGLYKFESKRHGTIIISIIDSELQFYCPHKREVYGKSFKYTGDNKYVEFRYHPHPDKKMTAKEFSGFIDLVEGDILSSEKPPQEEPSSKPSPKRKGGEGVYPELKKKSREEEKSTPLEKHLLELLGRDMINVLMENLNHEDAQNFIKASLLSKEIQISKQEYYRSVIFKFSLFSNITHGVEKDLVVNLIFDGDTKMFNPKDFPVLERAYFEKYSNINEVVGSEKLSGLKYLHSLFLEGQEWFKNQVAEETLKFLPQSITTFGFSGSNDPIQLDIFWEIFYNRLVLDGIPYTVILKDNFNLIEKAHNFPNPLMPHFFKTTSSTLSHIFFRNCTTLISRDETLLVFKSDQNFYTKNLIIQNPKQKFSNRMLNIFEVLQVFEFSGSIYPHDLSYRGEMDLTYNIIHIHVEGDVVFKINPGRWFIYPNLSVLRLPKYHWHSVGHIDLLDMPYLTVLELPVGADLSNLPKSLKVLVLTNFEDLNLRYDKMIAPPYLDFEKRGDDYGLPEQFPQSIQVFSITSKAGFEYLEEIKYLVSFLKNLVKYQGPVLEGFSESMKNRSIDTIYVGEDSSGELEEQWINKFVDQKTEHINFLKLDFKLHAPWENPWWEQIRQEEIKDPNKND